MGISRSEFWSLRHIGTASSENIVDEIYIVQNNRDPVVTMAVYKREMHDLINLLKEELEGDAKKSCND